MYRHIVVTTFQGDVSHDKAEQIVKEALSGHSAVWTGKLDRITVTSVNAASVRELINYLYPEMGLAQKEEDRGQDQST